MPTANLPPAVEQLLSLYGVKQKSVSPFQLAQFGQQFSNRDEMLSTLANYGEGQRGQINEEFTNRSNELLAHSAGAGLDLTSQYTSNGLGIERAKRSATGALNDQLIGDKLGILAGSNQTMQALLGSAAQANFQSTALDKQLFAQNRSQQLAAFYNPTLISLNALAKQSNGSDPMSQAPGFTNDVMAYKGLTNSLR